MFISDFAIKRPVVTVVSMVALSLFGVISLLRLKTDEFPDVQPPFVSVGLIYPGASPDGVEREVLEPIEEVVSSISGVKKLNGSAQDGYGQLIVEFNFDKPIAEATQDIRDAISGIRNDLPDELEEPVIKKISDTDRPIISLALTSDKLTAAELTRLADPGISRELRSIAGAAVVNILGKHERELTILLRPQALQAAGVSVSQVVTALRLQNIASPVGRIESDLEERSIRLQGRLAEPQDFLRLVVAERNGRIIRLGELAEAIDGTEEPRTLALYNGKEAVGINIKKAKGYSTTEVADKVMERLVTVRAGLPEGVTLEVVKDAGERVDNSVRNVEETLLEGALLTVLVVFLFLNSWRSTVITGLALPVSVLASFIAVYAFGFTLNTMSLLGLSLAIGILIDDAIVVRENIVRHVAMGKDRITAAREGTDEIGLAVTATTFSILAVFLPIAFLQGVSGQWFKPFALTIACSVAVSLFVSFSLDPMLSAYWPDPHQEEHEKGWLTRKLDRFNEWFEGLAGRYKLVIGWALDHRWTMVLISTATFAFALAMPAFQLVGVSFFPEEDRAEMNIQIETPPGSNLAYTRRKAEELIALVQRHKEVRYTYITMGGGGAGAVDEGNLFVRLTSRHSRDATAEEIAASVRSEVAGLTGVKVSVFTSDFGGGRKQLQLQVRGDDVPTLTATAEQIAAAVARVPNVVDLGLSSKGQKPEVTITLNRGLAGSLGVTVGDIAQSVRPAFAGIDAGDWVDPSGETRDVEVRLVPESRTRVEDLRRLPLLIRGANGLPTTIPLGQVADITASVGPAVINHLNRDPVVNVEWNVSGRSTGEVMTEVRKQVAQVQLPPGVRITEGGDSEQQSEVFGNIFVALGVAVMLMYLILVMQFGSFLDPLAILLSLPLSLIGVMLGLAVTGMTINIMSLIGVILLMGIVAKNAILLIDFAKWAREKDGLPLREALIQAGAIRLRPILMTTFALIAGMIPVALGRGEGAQFRAPLGVAVIGGVITSTLLTLVAIPTFYEILDGLRERMMHGSRNLFGGKAVRQAIAAASGEHNVGP
jgi:HAE1 family hydrophobic/amphiphilic exporter-1